MCRGLCNREEAMHVCQDNAKLATDCRLQFAVKSQESATVKIFGGSITASSCHTFTITKHTCGVRFQRRYRNYVKCQVHCIFSLFAATRKFSRKLMNENCFFSTPFISINKFTVTVEIIIISVSAKNR